MKKTGLLYVGVIAGIVLTVTFVFMAPGQVSLAKSSSAKAPAARALAISTSTPTPGAPSGGGDEAAPPDLSSGKINAQALPTPIPGESLVYFVTADSDATATVIILYNTDSVAHVVALRGYNYNGALGYSLNITVDAGSFLRLSSDSIAAAPPPSWATPAPIITNFTDFTYFASLSLPSGVRAEGYTLFNPGTGTVDPRADQGEIPLRFSTDPASLFLPTVLR